MHNISSLLNYLWLISLLHRSAGFPVAGSILFVNPLQSCLQDDIADYGNDKDDHHGKDLDASIEVGSGDEEADGS